MADDAPLALDASTRSALWGASMMGPSFDSPSLSDSVLNFSGSASLSPTIEDASSLLAESRLVREERSRRRDIEASYRTVWGWHVECWGSAMQRAAAAQCPVVTVTADELPALSGVYELGPPLRGYPCWWREGGGVLSVSAGGSHWLVSADVDDARESKGGIVSAHRHRGTLPCDMVGWFTSKTGETAALLAQAWMRAPGVEVLRQAVDLRQDSPTVLRETTVTEADCCCTVM
eukprot:TRINITY_DN48405_c0_g1_i1.p1 TRINITY_DN48405_c0_g1~~TRINITY_DN48405_c0_g1_i1.p1  ORF type:complete len:233 (+),score=39.68 TRINITY_DN48405_c0_g1_i1:48-746(+)